MSANIEQHEDGQFSYVGARQPAWHHLGVTYTDLDGITVEQALTDLDVGQIVKLPIQGVQLTSDGVTLVEDPRNVMTARVRQASVSPLGVVGTAYRIIDEHEGFAFLSNLVDSGDALVSSAALLDDGRRSFCCMRIPTDIQIGGVDAVDLYLVAAMSHDGSSSFTGLATPIRVECQNLLDMAVKGAQRVFKIRHTRKAELKVDEARRALDLTFRYAGAVQAEAEALIAKKVTYGQFMTLANGLYAPIGDSKRAATLWESKRGQLIELWNADTQAAIKGTAWGAFNTLVEWIDWVRPVRGVKGDQTAAKFERAIFGTNDAAALKAKALTAVKSL